MMTPLKFNRKKEILVVDDTPDNLRLLSAILTKKDYKVRKALNSKQAISSVKVDAPDLILLDIKMPETDGYETCILLKEDPETQTIPIIFISALDDALDKVKAFSVGGADYISKPFQEAEVLARIEHQLNLRDLQSQLEAQNQELSQSNQELEQFAHIVSHDLKQPLQSIIGYARIIGLQYPDLVESSAGKYLENIINAGDRMHRLIQDLLTYAKVGQEREAFSPVDCSAVLAAATSNLDQLLKESCAEVAMSTLPVIFGKEIQLVQLFQNLIENAIKFARPGIPPRIIITASSNQESDWLLTIEDNGIGISAEDLQVVFQKFHRLNSNDRYPGSGIGLATCKKIVENHGGHIWVESVLGTGSTFYITLPQRLPQEQ